MLTDRQEKFLARMVELYQLGASTTTRERVELGFAINAIRRGEKFSVAINKFNFKLRRKYKKKRLTEDLEDLIEELIDVYGEPIDPYEPKDIGDINAGWFL